MKIQDPILFEFYFLSFFFFLERFLKLYPPPPALKQYDIKSVYSESIVQKEILFFFFK